MTRDVSAQFEVAMRQIYDRAKAELGYHPTGFLGMLERLGGVATAADLLNRRVSAISDGFTRLQQEGRLDLSVEALALKPEWRDLFTGQQLETARRRLREARYTDIAD